jgi:membrane glycosyltransferase
VRATPFRRHCRLPVLPGPPPLGGHILSHDLPEAALMRRAGYECRVIPVEMESWEENPPTLLDFIRRDLRWCNGNMQATRLQTLRGMTPLSRFHLLTASAMFLGAPAWMLMAVAAVTKILTGDGGIDVAIGTAMFFGMLMISLAPKAVGLVDVALTTGGAARFGGGLRLAISALAELFLSILMAPVVALQVTLFLIGLAFGYRVPWSGQNRDAYRVEWADAARRLWPQTTFGLGLLSVGWGLAGGGAVAWGAPMIAGLVLAVPYAVLTAAPALGRWAERAGLCAVPEEIAAPETLRRLLAPEGPEPPLKPLRAA